MSTIGATAPLLRLFPPACRRSSAGRSYPTPRFRLDERTLTYFRELAAELDVPYQTLINLYLRDCAESGRRPAMHWRPPRKGAA